MQQGLGPRPFDVTSRLLVDGDPAGWLRWIGLPVDGPVLAIDSEISTVLAEVDKVLRVDGVSPWLAHLELQSSYDPILSIRLLQYNSLLLRRHLLPVESIVVLLRSQAEGSPMSGRLDVHSPAGRTIVTFHFQVVRLWERPVEELLAGGLGLLPLAPLARLDSTPLDDVVDRMAERLARDAPPEATGDFWANTRILMGLRYDREEVRYVLRRVREMRDSVTYMEILEEGLIEGEARGRIEGRAEEARRLIVLLGTAKFGPVDEATRAQIERLDDPATLERIAERLLSASTWHDLIADGA